MIRSFLKKFAKVLLAKGPKESCISDMRSHYRLVVIGVSGL